MHNGPLEGQKTRAKSLWNKGKLIGSKLPAKNCCIPERRRVFASRS
jgi:hypothetical protein